MRFFLVPVFILLLFSPTLYGQDGDITDIEEAELSLEDDLTGGLEDELEDDLDDDLGDSFGDEFDESDEKPEKAYAGEPLPSAKDVEKKLGDIFQTYENLPKKKIQIPIELEDARIQKYKVRRGDTLWSISRMFFGDGFYWPKIWSYNPQVTNPHQISTNDMISFDPGDGSVAPIFLVEKGRFNGVEIPPPEKRTLPVLRLLPPSLPPDPQEYGSQQNADNDIVIDTTKKLKPTARMLLPIYISEQEPISIGSVVEALGPQQTAGFLQSVYVEMEAGTAGEIYSIVRADSRTMSFEDGDETQSLSVYVVETVGAIRLKERVNESDNLFRAQIVQSADIVNVGDTVVPKSIPVARVSQTGQKVRVRGKIVGGAADRNVQVMGIGSTIFLNVGKNQGLRDGDLVSILANESLRNPSTDVEIAHRKIGEAKVLRTDTNVSTAVLVYANSEILVGDVTL